MPGYNPALELWNVDEYFTLINDCGVSLFLSISVTIELESSKPSRDRRIFRSIGKLIMPEKYEYRGTSAKSSEIAAVVLRETESTRLVLRATIVENENNPDAGVKITLAHQRKAPITPWVDVPTKRLSSLKIGEEAKLRLDSSTTLELFHRLEDLYAIKSAEGVRSGEISLVVGREDEIIKTDESRAKIINNLLAQGFSTEIWDALAVENPSLATRLSYARIHTERETVLQEFETNLNQTLGEEYWQTFFQRNTWIFGYGLNYQILKSITPQANVGGADIRSQGAQITDFLGSTGAKVKFTVLVEIKRPDTSLFENTHHRPSVPMLGKNLIGGVAQLQNNCKIWEVEGSQTQQNREHLPDTDTIQPKGILVIGQLNSSDDLSKRRTFELFRRNMSNPEIITFDELFERARFILDHID